MLAFMDYGRPVRRFSSLHGQKSSPTHKFFGTVEAYFVCHMVHIFSFDLCLHWVSVVRECKYSDLSPYSLFETLQMFTLDTPCPPLFLCKKGATTSSFGKYFPRKCVFSREKLFKVMLGKISYYAVFVQALPSALLLLLLWYSSAQCVHLSI